jgi:ribonuclease HI
LTVQVYTDGACSQTSGHGGWAALMVVDGVLIDGRYGGAKNVTNNQMELQGLIEGLKLLPLLEHLRCADCGVVPSKCMKIQPKDCPILGTIMRPVYPEAVVISDSQYCVMGAVLWVHTWKGNGWKTQQKQPVKNQSQWEEVDKLSRQTIATFQWVKGHSGDDYNDLADVWAVAGKSQMYGNQAPAFSAEIPTIGS